MHRRVQKPVARFCLFAMVLSAFTAPAEEPRPNLTVVQPPTREVETSAGRWRVPEDPPSPFKSQGKVQSEASALPAPLLAGLKIAPMARNPADLSRLLVAGNLSPEFLANNMPRYMQVVPGVPDRYREDRFRPTRDAFTQKCAQSAGGYQSLAVALMRSPQFSTDIASPRTFDLSGNYERDCLTPLEQVPAPIRAVTGVLITAQGVPWCSATIIGPRRLLTARHCFVDPVTGNATPEHAQLGAGRIAFISISPHDDTDAFTARWLGESAPLGKFESFDDYHVLTIDGMFTRQAAVSAAKLEDATMPQPVWIVGSNANLGDLGRAQTPLQFTRGSSPMACSILEVSTKGCLYHVCQTGKATSGAGVLALNSSGDVTLLGVHTAAITEASGCGGKPPLGDKLNLAINITNNNIGP